MPQLSPGQAGLPILMKSGGWCGRAAKAVLEYNASSIPGTISTVRENYQLNSLVMTPETVVPT